MILTTWREPARVIADSSAQDFFDTPLPETNVFLFETSHLEMAPHAGAFSLKTVISGEEEYFLGRRRVGVRPGELLAVNCGETYGSRIRSPTGSLSLFFPSEGVAEALRALTAAPAELVDQPDRAAPCPEAPPVRFRASRRTRCTLAALLQHLRCGDLVAGEEAAMDLLLEALRDLHDIAAPQTLPGVRKDATRAELLARIGQAREYIDDMHGIHCTLERLAAIACLSKFHFLRVFRAVTGETPASYARRRRLQRAAQAIARGEPRELAARRAGYADRHVLRRALTAHGMQAPRN